MKNTIKSTNTLVTELIKLRDAYLNKNQFDSLYQDERVRIESILRREALEGSSRAIVTFNTYELPEEIKRSISTVNTYFNYVVTRFISENNGISAEPAAGEWQFNDKFLFRW